MCVGCKWWVVYTSHVATRKVLQSIKSQTSQPSKPFAISKQYKAKKGKEEEKKDACADPDRDDDEEDVCEQPEVSSTKVKPSKKSTKESSKKKTPVKKNVEVQPECLYEPSVYAQKRKAFIDGLRNNGHSFEIANTTWNFSQDKRKLLAGVSLAELKRRRFLPKEATENPWAKSK